MSTLIHLTRCTVLLTAFGLWAASGLALAAEEPVNATPRMLSEHASEWAYRTPAPLSSLAVQGRALYLEGRRANGSELTARRALGDEQSSKVSGQTAACVQCHKASGLGSVEGDVLVSPISGRALYEPGTVAVPMDTRARKWLNTSHAPYTLDSLGQALTQGRHVSGRDMHVLMPRYDLAEQEVRALDAYLRTLSVTWSPGVNAQRIRIASVITPDVASAKRDAAIDTMRMVVSRKNLGTRPGRRHMVSSLEFVLRTERQWEHEVWELTGPAETWTEQLRAKHAAKPVFAVVSGVARDWSPVHAFCQSEQVPCWFPVAESLPANVKSDGFGLYFNAGVSLEAEVIAEGILAQGKNTSARVLQVVSPDVVARRAASDLVQHMAGKGPTVQTLEVGQVSAVELKTRLAQLKSQDALVLWLRPADMALLDAVAAPKASVWVDALLSGGDTLVLPEAWRDNTTMSYPYEMSSMRQGNLSGFKSVMNMARKPLIDEALQSQIYFAMTAFNETVAEMLNNFHGAYLIERAESMLSRRERETANAQMVAQRSLRKVALDLRASVRAAEAASQATADEAASLVPAVRTEDLTASREGTSIYPRLSLGPGQRLASKGAWLVKLQTQDGQQVFAKDLQWIVP